MIMKRATLIPFALLVALALAALFVPRSTTAVPTGGPINPGDVAWMLTASALVLLMTPGLSFFYGGMVNRKNVLSTMIKSFVAAGIVSILWLVFGFSMSFGPTVHGVVGNPLSFAFFKGVFSSAPWAGGPTIPLPF